MNLENLQIWKRSVHLAEVVYDVTKEFPKDEQYCLTSQIRRAAVSVPSNIAEGSQRVSDKDFAKFVLIAKGSLAELQTQLFLSYRFAYLSTDKWQILKKELEELHRMMHAFHSKLAARSS